MPTPAPPQPAPDPLHAFVHGFWTGLEHTAAQSPWVVAVIGAMLLTGVIGSARRALHTGPKDPIRRFTRADKALLFARAGRRCEHHGLFGRCTSTERLEADHIHPHSRGGWTHVSNGQILCKAQSQAHEHPLGPVAAQDLRAARGLLPDGSGPHHRPPADDPVAEGVSLTGQPPAVPPAILPLSHLLVHTRGMTQAP